MGKVVRAGPDSTGVESEGSDSADLQPREPAKSETAKNVVRVLLNIARLNRLCERNLEELQKELAVQEQPESQERNILR